MTISRTQNIALAAFVVLAMLGGAIRIWAFFLAWEQLLGAFPPWSIFALIGIAIARVLSLVAVLLNSKTGVVLYVALTAAATAISLIVGLSPSLLSIVAAVILAVLVWPKWQQMSWALVANNSSKPTPLRGAA